MKIEYVNYENKKLYDTFIKENGNVFQSLEWIIANNIDKYGALMVTEEEKIYMTGAYIITFDKETKEKSVYFPKGPIICEANEEAFKIFLNETIKVSEKNNCKNIRIDYVFNNKDNEFIENSFLNNNFKKSFFTNFWDYTWIIPIANLTSEEYLNNLKQKTRYNINYAKKHGVKVLIDNSQISKDKFYELLKITASRDKFNIKKKECYDNIIELFKKNANIFWAYKEDKLLSAAIEIIFGDKAYYIYGASSNYDRNLQSTFLLQYEMISYAIDNGCKLYDMGGVGIKLKNGDKFYNGLLEFKSKFGGILDKSIKSYILNLRGN